MQKYKIWQVKLSPSQLNDLENREDVPEWYRDYLDTTMYPTKDKVRLEKEIIDVSIRKKKRQL